MVSRRLFDQNHRVCQKSVLYFTVGLDMFDGGAYSADSNDILMGHIMKKTLLASCVLAAAVNVNAAEFNLAEKYVVGNAMVTELGDGADSTFGMGVGIGVPVSGVELIKGSELIVEAGVNYLGENETSESFSGQTITASVSATNVYGLGKMRFAIQNQIFAYGKLGVNFISVEAEASGGGFTSSASDSEIKILFGAGAEYQLNNQLSLSAEYMAYASDITSLSANVAFKF